MGPLIFLFRDMCFKFLARAISVLLSVKTCPCWKDDPFCCYYRFAEGILGYLICY